MIFLCRILLNCDIKQLKGFLEFFKTLAKMKNEGLFPSVKLQVADWATCYMKLSATVAYDCKICISMLDVERFLNRSRFI